jgi:hypothetical protein
LRFEIVSLCLGGTFVPSSWLHDSCLKISVLSCIELFTCIIVVHELCANDNDLYVVVRNGLVDALDASVLWLHTIAKFVINCSCKLQEIG